MKKENLKTAIELAELLERKITVCDESDTFICFGSMSKDQKRACEKKFHARIIKVA